MQCVKNYGFVNNMLSNTILCLMPTNLNACSFLVRDIGHFHVQRPPFYINNSAVEYVDQWPHLGHVISSDMDDKNDINRGRSALISQKYVLCFFGKLDCVT